MKPQAYNIKNEKIRMAFNDLKKNHPEKFGVYYDILQRFARYGTAKTDEQKRILYKKSYDLI